MVENAGSPMKPCGDDHLFAKITGYIYILASSRLECPARHKRMVSNFTGARWITRIRFYPGKDTRICRFFRDVPPRSGRITASQKVLARQGAFLLTLDQRPALAATGF
jgi:hypothetical protein